MRTLGLFVLVGLVGCGGKKPPETPAPAPEPAPAPAPVHPPAPAPEMAEAPAGPRPNNTDFNVAFTWADGTSTKGHVVRIERSVGWYGEEWTDAPAKLNVTLEGEGTEVEVPWTDITKVDITYGAKTDLNCSYDSQSTPTTYICELKTTTKVKTKDGKTWDAADRHKWRFVTATGDEHEFWIYKLPARKQEEKVPEIGSDDTDTTAIYAALETELEAMKKGKVPTSITVLAP